MREKFGRFNVTDTGKTVIVATMGSPDILRRVWYRIPTAAGEIRVCSAGSIAPTVAKRVMSGEGVNSLVIVVPHSVENSASDLRDDLSAKDWGGGAKRKVREHVERELHSTADQLESKGGADALRAARVLRETAERLIVEVTQGVGTFLDASTDPPAYVRFKGGASHSFFAVFERLNELSGGFEVPLRVIVDATHGWNFFSVLTLLAASAFVRACPESELEVEISEPFISGVTEACEENRGKSERKAPPPGRLPLSLLEVEDVSRALKAVEAVSKAVSLDHRPLEEILTEQGERWPDPVKEVLREVSRAICGLRSGVSVYSYHHLARLDEMLSDAGLEDEVDWLEYDLREDSERGGVVVEYIHGTPRAERIVLETARNLLRGLGVGQPEGSLRPDAGWSPGEMPLSFLRRLLTFYRERGMILQSHTLEAELYYLRELDPELSRMISLAEEDVEKTGGKGGEKIARYLEFMERRRLDPKALQALEDLPLFSLYCACSSSLGNILDAALPLENLRAKLVEVISEIKKGEVPSGCKADWSRNLRFAWSLSESPAEEAEGWLPVLIRNLTAHAGLQHFAIKNVVRRREITLLYDVEFIEALDRLLGNLCTPKPETP